MAAYPPSAFLSDRPQSGPTQSLPDIPTAPNVVHILIAVMYIMAKQVPSHTWKMARHVSAHSPLFHTGHDPGLVRKLLGSVPLNKQQWLQKHLPEVAEKLLEDLHKKNNNVVSEELTDEKVAKDFMSAESSPVPVNSSETPLTTSDRGDPEIMTVPRCPSADSGDLAVVRQDGEAADDVADRASSLGASFLTALPTITECDEEDDLGQVNETTHILVDVSSPWLPLISDTDHVAGIKHEDLSGDRSLLKVLRLAEFDRQFNTHNAITAEYARFLKVLSEEFDGSQQADAAAVAADTLSPNNEDMSKLRTSDISAGFGVCNINSAIEEIQKPMVVVDDVDDHDWDEKGHSEHSLMDMLPVLPTRSSTNETLQSWEVLSFDEDNIEDTGSEGSIHTAKYNAAACSKYLRRQSEAYPFAPKTALGMLKRIAKSTKVENTRVIPTLSINTTATACTSDDDKISPTDSNSDGSVSPLSATSRFALGRRLIEAGKAILDGIAVVLTEVDKITGGSGVKIKISPPASDKLAPPGKISSPPVTPIIDPRYLSTAWIPRTQPVDIMLRIERRGEPDDNIMALNVPQDSTLRQFKAEVEDDLGFAVDFYSIVYRHGRYTYRPIHSESEFSEWMAGRVREEDAQLRLVVRKKG